MTDRTRLLADPNDIVPMEAHASLRAHFGSVPGVRVTRVGVRKSDVAGWSMMVSVRGWSPSLHELAIDYVRDVPIRSGALTITAHDAAHAFDDAVAEQRRRASDAMSMGRPTPLDVDDDSNSYADVRRPVCRHLLVDRALPVLAHLDGDDLGRLVAASVHELHRLPSDSMGGPLLADATTYVIEDVAARLVGVLVPIDTVDGKPSTFDGRWLRIGGGVDLPETVVGSLVGRKVRDVLPLHATIDDRIVVEAIASDDEGNLALRLETLTIPMAGVEGELQRWRAENEED